MNPFRFRVVVTILLVTFLANCDSAWGQDANVASASASTEEPVVLSPFEVSAGSDIGYLSKETTASGRVAQSLENIPQSINVVNAAMLEDIDPTSALDALRFVTGTSPNADETSTTSISVRGFAAPSILRNGAHSGNASFPNMEFTEQLEVVKGPAAVLYGASNPGGTVNNVTKRPRFKQADSVTFSTYALSNTSGYSTFLDSTGPLPRLRNRDGQPLVAYRLMAVHQRLDDFRINKDIVNRDAFLAALDFNVTRELKIHTEYEQTQYITNIPAALLLAASEAAKPAQDRLMPNSYVSMDWTAQSDDSRRYNYSRDWQTSVTYTKDLGRFGTWTARVFLSLEGSYNTRAQTIATGNNSRPRPVTQADLGKVVNLNQVITQADINAGRLWVPVRSMQASTFMNDDDLYSQWDVTGRFNTGPLTHTLLLGTETDWGTRNKRVPFGGRENDVRTVIAYSGNGGRALAVWVDHPNLAPIPVNWNDIRSPSNPNGTIQQTLQGATFDGSGYKVRVPWINVTPDAYYVHDDVGMLHDRVVATFGARHDDIQQDVRGLVKTFSQWTYRYGAVLKLTSWANVYASHSESFTANSQTAAGDLNRVIPPQQGAQNEVGARLSFFHNRLGVAIAGYRITNSNLVVRNSFAPVGAPPEAFWTVIDGNLVKGTDVTITGNLSAHTQCIAMYTYLDGMSTPTPDQVHANPGLTSVPLNQIPRHQASFWGKYTFATGRLKGLNVRLGYRWTGERAGGRAGFLPDMYLPAYGNAELGVGYVWRNISASLTIRNAFNAWGFRSTGGEAVVNVEKPRTMTCTVKYSF